MGQDVKNPLRAQSKYGLMGSSAKPGNFFFQGHQSPFCIKMPFGIGHPPPTHQMQSTCVWEGSRVPNLQTEFNLKSKQKLSGVRISVGFLEFLVLTKILMMIKLVLECLFYHLVVINECPQLVCTHSIY